MFTKSQKNKFVRFHSFEIFLLHWYVTKHTRNFNLFYGRHWLRRAIVCNNNKPAMFSHRQISKYRFDWNKMETFTKWRNYYFEHSAWDVWLVKRNKYVMVKKPRRVQSRQYIRRVDKFKVKFSCRQSKVWR